MKNDPATPYPVLESTIQYKGRAFNVRRDHVRLPNGKTTNLDVVEHTGAVTMLPYDGDGNIWFVRQYRHPAGETLLELPAGTLEPGEPPEEAAAREIREEIGMAAGSLRKIGEFFMVPGYSSECMHVFLATDLTPDPLKRDADEFIDVEVIPYKQALEMVAAGQVRDGKTIAVLYMAKQLLGW
jgi:ADP-ribose pyrophosphatase